MADLLTPDYYAGFQCIGAECEDSCCKGWSIGIDRDTYHAYKSNRHPALAPLIKIAVHRNAKAESNSNTSFGTMRMRDDGSCHFLDHDSLCLIQKTLGAQALGNVCRIYPRYLNRFGQQRENSLSISCPQAARLILLRREPITFAASPADAVYDSKAFTSYAYPRHGDDDPEQIAVLNHLRALIIAILQLRTISIGARVVLLGFLLEDASRVMGAAPVVHASALLPTLQSFAGMLEHPQALEQQYGAIAADTPRRLRAVARLMVDAMNSSATRRFKDCLQLAARGLGVDGDNGASGSTVHAYLQAYEQYYAPFIADRAHILENYLVNDVVTRLFPFTRGTFLDLYREMVCNLGVLEVLMVGLSAHDKGLGEERVVQLFQSFVRSVTHNSKHLDLLIGSLKAGPDDAFIHIMWMLKGQA
jgi:lysine-N-methylase